MLIKRMSCRQIFITSCLTILEVNIGIALCVGIGILLRLCRHYGFGVGDVLVGFQSLLPWSDNLPSTELLGVVALILQYVWVCAIVGAMQVFWRAPSWPGAAHIPDYDLRVNILAGTCSRNDGVLWRYSQPKIRYQNYRWILIILDVVALALVVPTTPKTYVEYKIPFLYSVPLWNVGEVYALDTVATATMLSALMVSMLMIALSVTEQFCHLWQRVRRL